MPDWQNVYDPDRHKTLRYRTDPAQQNDRVFRWAVGILLNVEADFLGFFVDINKFSCLDFYDNVFKVYILYVMYWYISHDPLFMFIYIIV